MAIALQSPDCQLQELELCLDCCPVKRNPPLTTLFASLEKNPFLKKLTVAANGGLSHLKELTLEVPIGMIPNLRSLTLFPGHTVNCRPSSVLQDLPENKKLLTVQIGVDPNLALVDFVCWRNRSLHLMEAMQAPPRSSLSFALAAVSSSFGVATQASIHFLLLRQHAHKVFGDCCAQSTKRPAAVEDRCCD